MRRRRNSAAIKSIGSSFVFELWEHHRICMPECLADADIFWETGSIPFNKFQLTTFLDG